MMFGCSPVHLVYWSVTFWSTEILLNLICQFNNSFWTDSLFEILFIGKEKKKKSVAVLWIRGRPVAECNPLLGQAIQYDPPEVAQWATQLSISGNIIKQKTCFNN